MKNDLLEANLKNRENDLNNFKSNLTYKRKFIDNVQAQLITIQKEPPKKLDAKLSELIREFNNYKSMDKNIEVLQQDLDKVNAAFFKKLSAKHPTLTKSEKELCGLLLLNIPSKDIANIRSISLESVKKARHRLRKKSPIQETESLSDFLESID